MNVVVSMTTLPSRIARIRPMVESIRNQTRKPDWFVLWLPETCEKEKAGYEVPEWIADDVRPTVMPVVRDWGPVTKLIPLLSMSWAPDVLLVTVDDDVVYHPELLQELEEVSKARRFPDSAIGLVGVKEGTYIHAEQVKAWSSHGMEVDVIGGYRGVAYRRDLFDESLEADAEELLKGGPFVLDDHLISWNLKRRAKKLVVMRTMFGSPGGRNFRFLNFGNGIYDEGSNREMVNDSMRRIRELYDRNGWRHL